MNKKNTWVIIVIIIIAVVAVLLLNKSKTSPATAVPEGSQEAASGKGNNGGNANTPGKAAVLVSGSSSVHSPFTGTEPMTFTITGLTPGTIYNMVIPTNSYNGQVSYEAAAQIPASAAGSITWVFNNDPLADYLKPITANKWVLPAGQYQFRVIQPSMNKDVASATITVVK